MGQVNSNDWAYLAGIIDGEGCIYSCDYKGAGRFHVRIQVTQREPTIIGWIYQTFRLGRRLEIKKRRSRNKGRGYVWACSRREQVEIILRGVIPFLIYKKGQAELALELCGRPALSRQREIDTQLRTLKRPGEGKEWAS